MMVQRHHTYPHKWRHKQNGTTEVKMVNGKKHRAWHILVGDMNPRQALQYLAENFLPSNLQISVREL